MKYAFILSPLLLLAGVVSGQPNHSSNKRNPAPADNPVTVANQNNQTCACQHTEKTEAAAPQWYAPLKRPEWWLVVLGFATLGIVLYQAIKTADATEAMQKSVVLQEATFKQWLDIKNWTCHTTLGTKERTKEPFLVFEFDIVNPTEHVLTVVGLTWKSNSDSRRANINTPIVPKGCHPTVIDYLVTKEEATAFQQSVPIQLTINGEISFVDALEKSQNQPFTVSFHCRNDIGILIVRPFQNAGWVLGQHPDEEQK